MITRYLTSLQATFNPLSPHKSHKIPRLILALLSSTARSAAGANIQVTTNQLPSASTEQCSLIASFKDGRKMVFKEGRSARQRGEKVAKGAADEGGLTGEEYDLRKLSINDVVVELDRHSRALTRKDELSGER